MLTHPRYRGKTNAQIEAERRRELKAERTGKFNYSNYDSSDLGNPKNYVKVTKKKMHKGAKKAHKKIKIGRLTFIW